MNEDANGIHIGESTVEIVLSVDDVIVDQEHYQRPLSLVWARKIAREFDPKMFGKPIVGQRRDGKYAVIDGQHRIWALRIKWPQTPVTFKADVLIENTSIQDEARRFTAENVSVKKPDTGTQLKALVAAEDADALAYINVVQSIGFRMKSGGGRLQAGEIHAYVFRSAQKWGSTHWRFHLAAALRLCQQTWGTNEFPLPSALIGGLVLFFRRHGQDERLDADRLIARLQQRIPMVLAAEGSARAQLEHTRPEEGVYASILAIYNARLNEKNQLKIS